MNSDKLNKILDLHKAWLCGEEDGCRADLLYADLLYADLRGANLLYADLRDADLRSANLRDADLRYANLRGANLLYADLRGANLLYADLRDADLRYADLLYADLRDANLRDADLRGANFDMSCWPLCCGSFSPKMTCDRLTAQMVRHCREVARANPSEYGKAVDAALTPLDNFHNYRDDVEPMKPRD